MELLPSAQYSSRNENFVSTSKYLPKKQQFNFSRSALLHMKSRACLKYLVNGSYRWSLYRFSLSFRIRMEVNCLYIYGS